MISVLLPPLLPPPPPAITASRRVKACIFEKQLLRCDSASQMSLCLFHLYSSVHHITPFLTSSTSCFFFFFFFNLLLDLKFKFCLHLLQCQKTQTHSGDGWRGAPTARCWPTPTALAPSGCLTSWEANFLSSPR